MSQETLFPKTELEKTIEEAEATVKVLDDVVKARDKSVESAEEKAAEARTDAYKARHVLEYLRHEFKLTAASTAVRDDDDGAGNGPLAEVDPLCIGELCGGYTCQAEIEEGGPGTCGTCSAVEDLNLVIVSSTPCPVIAKGGVRPDVVAAPTGNLLCVGADCEYYKRNDDCDFVDDECAYGDEPFEVKVGETSCPMADATTSGPSDYEFAVEYGSLVGAIESGQLEPTEGDAQRVNVLAALLTDRGIDPQDWQAIIGVRQLVLCAYCHEPLGDTPSVSVDCDGYLSNVHTACWDAGAEANGDESAGDEDAPVISPGVVAQGGV